MNITTRRLLASTAVAAIAAATPLVATASTGSTGSADRCPYGNPAPNGAVCVAPTTTPTDFPVPESIRHLCAYEDSGNCFWNADTMGNHRGHSFYAIQFPHRTCVVYVDAKFARHHNRCWGE